MNTGWPTNASGRPLKATPIGLIWGELFQLKWPDMWNNTEWRTFAVRREGGHSWKCSHKSALSVCPKNDKYQDHKSPAIPRVGSKFQSHKTTLPWSIRIKSEMCFVVGRCYTQKRAFRRPIFRSSDSITQLTWIAKMSLAKDFRLKSIRIDGPSHNKIDMPNFTYPSVYYLPNLYSTSCRRRFRRHWGSTTI